jgi:nucleoid-associated protein EbfC
MSQDNPLNLQELLQTAQHVQKELARVQAELAHKTVEGSAGGGMVTAVANGRQQLVSVHIEEDVVQSKDIPMLEDLIVAAVNHALTKSAELAQQELGQVTGQMNMHLTGIL